MKNLLLFSLLLLGFIGNLQAQENSTSFRLELSSSTLFTQDDAIESSPGLGIQITENLFNYNLQVSGFWEMGDRLELGIGLAFANRDAYSICYCEFCDKIAYPDVYSKFRSIELPIEVRLKFLKEEGRLNPFASFGLTGRIPFAYQGLINEEQFGLDKKQISTSIALGLGTNVKLNEKWALLLATHALKNSHFQISGESTLPRGSGGKVINEWQVKLGLSRSF